uniref:Angiopoietin-2-like n=1 Tax=Salmo trutta TaxID=8032 RepID=A0A673ZZE1_SALTR
MGRLLALSLAYLVYLSTAVIGSEKKQHLVQHGPCSYTFILPEVEHCQPLKDYQVTNSLQRDFPPPPSRQERKLESLRSSTENNTQWLQKLERSIQENLRSGMEEMKRNAVHTQTAAMLEIGTNLLSQSAEQTRKLTDVETKVLNQTSRMEIQLLEYSLFTDRLEKHILQQNQEISRLNDKSRYSSPIQHVLRGPYPPLPQRALSTTPSEGPVHHTLRGPYPPHPQRALSTTPSEGPVHHALRGPCPPHPQRALSTTPSEGPIHHTLRGPYPPHPQRALSTTPSEGPIHHTLRGPYPYPPHPQRALSTTPSEG